jgi:hypothetical protein
MNRAVAKMLLLNTATSLRNYVHLQSFTGLIACFLFDQLKVYDSKGGDTVRDWTTK